MQIYILLYVNVVVPFDFGINYNWWALEVIQNIVVVPFDFGINYNFNFYR